MIEKTYAMAQAMRFEMLPKFPDVQGRRELAYALQDVCRDDAAARDLVSALLQSRHVCPLPADIRDAALADFERSRKPEPSPEQQPAPEPEPHPFERILGHQQFYADLDRHPDEIARLEGMLEHPRAAVRKFGQQVLAGLSEYRKARPGPAPPANATVPESVIAPHVHAPRGARCQICMDTGWRYSDRPRPGAVGTVKRCRCVNVEYTETVQHARAR